MTASLFYVVEDSVGYSWMTVLICSRLRILSRFRVATVRISVNTCIRPLKKCVHIYTHFSFIFTHNVLPNARIGLSMATLSFGFTYFVTWLLNTASCPSAICFIEGQLVWFLGTRLRCIMKASSLANQGIFKYQLRCLGFLGYYLARVSMCRYLGVDVHILCHLCAHILWWHNKCFFVDNLAIWRIKWLNFDVIKHFLLYKKIRNTVIL